MSDILSFPLTAPDATRVLLAEDDAVLRRRLKRILQSEGFAVIAAEDGAEALSLSIEFAPDLILSDIKMPRLDGHGLLEAVRANPDTAHIPFVFLTVRDKPDDLRLGLSLGADDYLTKPVSRDALMAAIRMRLKRHEVISRAPAKRAASPLEGRLRHALANDEFRLVYQPQLALGPLRVTGAEALIRWGRAEPFTHPGDAGLVPPSSFIPAAEQAGMIEAVTAWVLERACRDTLKWNRDTGTMLRTGVNISARHVAGSTLAGMVERTLAQSGLPPEQLHIEITESGALWDIDACAVTLAVIRATGVTISLDDFGTGYSSLSYLSRLPFDILKIDRAFVKGVQDNAANGAIVEAVIRLARQLRLRVIAEGVEDEHEVAWLAARGCDEYQGYFFSRPLTACGFGKYLAQNARLAA